MYYRALFLAVLLYVMPNIAMAGRYPQIPSYTMGESTISILPIINGDYRFKITTPHKTRPVAKGLTHIALVSDESKGGTSYAFLINPGKSPSYFRVEIPGQGTYRVPPYRPGQKVCRPTPRSYSPPAVYRPRTRSSYKSTVSGPISRSSSSSSGSSRGYYYRNGYHKAALQRNSDGTVQAINPSYNYPQTGPARGPKRRIRRTASGREYIIIEGERKFLKRR